MILTYVDLEFQNMYSTLTESYKKKVTLPFINASSISDQNELSITMIEFLNLSAETAKFDCHVHIYHLDIW